MGQGAGLGMLAPIKIATEKTIFAMPEGRIGFFVDAGGSYFLNQAKGNCGLYLAITGARIKGNQLLQAGLATHYVKEEKIEPMTQDIIQLTNSGSLKNLNKTQKVEQISNIIEKYQDENQKNQCFENQVLIDDIFDAESIEQLMENIKQNQHLQFVQEISNQISETCPWSTYTNFELFKKVKKEKLTLQQCVELDFRLVLWFLARKDFFEGIRCALVDKQDKPNWQIKDILGIKRANILEQIENPIDFSLENQVFLSFVIVILTIYKICK